MKPYDLGYFGNDPQVLRYLRKVLKPKTEKANQPNPNAIDRKIMSNQKVRKPFVVRGINIEKAGQFNSLGRLIDLPSYAEVTVDRQHDAVAEILTNSAIASMGARKLTNRNDLQPLTTGPIPVSDTVKEAYVVDLVIVTTASKVEELRPIRSNVRDVLKTWAEKSRVKGRRGWRASAIKTPSFEFDKTVGSVIIRTQVVLSTAIFYDHDTATVNVSFDPIMEEEDLRSLHRELSRYTHTNGFYSHLKYRHSEIGDGEVL